LAIYSCIAGFSLSLFVVANVALTRVCRRQLDPQVQETWQLRPNQQQQPQQATLQLLLLPQRKMAVVVVAVLLANRARAVQAIV
jgi:hypothetical protein